MLTGTTGVKIYGGELPDVVLLLKAIWRVTKVDDRSQDMIWIVWTILTRLIELASCLFLSFKSNTSKALPLFFSYFI